MKNFNFLFLLFISACVLPVSNVAINNETKITPLYLTALANDGAKGLTKAEKIGLTFHLINTTKEKDATFEFKRWLLSDLIQFGLTDVANDYYLSWRERLTVLEKGNFLFSRIDTDLVAHLIASLIVEGKIKEAKKMVDTFDYTYPFSQRYEQKFFFLKEYLNPKFTKAQTYDLFIEGVTKGIREIVAPEFTLEEKREFGSQQGWLWAIKSGPPALKKLGYDYLLKNDFPEMAAFIYKQKWITVEHLNPKLSRKISNSLGATYQAKVLEIGQKLAGLEKQPNETQTTSNPSVLKKIQPHPIKRPIFFKEKSLAPALTASKKEIKKQMERYFPASFPDGLKILPVSKYQVERIEKKGEQITLVYSSFAYAGENDAGGYWVTRSTDGGLHWTEPLYLGIQKYSPYFVLSNSKMSIGTDDKITLEVAIREIDRKNQTLPPEWPPIVSRSEEGLYLEFDWKDIERDTDGDNITDIMEMHLSLNPQNSDTDGDGIIDGQDSIPHLPFQHQDENINTMAVKILEEMTGWQIESIPSGGNIPYALMVNVGQARPEFFAGLKLPVRMILYTDKEIKAINKNKVFYPLQIKGFFANKDYSKIYVVWDEVYRGGEFKIIKQGNDYKVEKFGEWIT